MVLVMNKPSIKDYMLLELVEEVAINQRCSTCKVNYKCHNLSQCLLLHFELFNEKALKRRERDNNDNETFTINDIIKLR